MTAIVDRMNYIDTCGITYGINEAKALITKLVKSHMEHGDDADSARILYLCGPHGIGKTRLLQQIAEELGLAHASFHAGAVDSQDNTGLQERIDGKSAHLNPAHIPIFTPPKSATGFGLFVIEEIRSNDNPEFQNQARQLAEGQLGELRKHPNWILASTSNPETDAYCTVNRIDEALASRLIPIPIYPSVEERLTYWRNVKPEPMYEPLWWFLNVHQAFVEDFDSRTWYSLGKTLKGLDPKPLTKEERALFQQDLDVAQESEKKGKKKKGSDDDSEPVKERASSKRKGGTAWMKMIELCTCTEVAVMFEQFLVKGSNPDAYPIAAEVIANAKGAAFEKLMKRIERWTERDGDNTDRSALVGATAIDIGAFCKSNEARKDMAANFARFFEILSGNGFADMFINFMTTTVKDPAWAGMFVNELKRTCADSRAYDLYAAEQKDCK